MSQSQSPPSGDSFPRVLGKRPVKKPSPDRDEETQYELALPREPPPKLTVLGPVSVRSSSSRPRAGSESYRLGKLIGSGGMATVYQATKEGADGFRRSVAVKRIHQHLAKNPQFVELLADEARLCSAIQHPNVCQVLDFVEDDAGGFIVMELLDGCTLLEVFRALMHAPQRVSWPRHQLIVARIIAGLADGLHAAHELKDERGELLDVVHRDVTPHNMFVLTSGAVKVTDFGVARAKNQMHHTATGVVKGKLAYTAPEQLHHSGVDRRTDVFALGIVMWELLTAERLFLRSSEASTLAAVTGGGVPDPATRQRVILPEISAIVAKALASNPADRFRTAREMSRALERTIPGGHDAVSNGDVADWVEELRAPKTAHPTGSWPQSADKTASVHTADLRVALDAAKEAPTQADLAPRKMPLLGKRTLTALSLVLVAAAPVLVMGVLHAQLSSVPAAPAASAFTRPAAEPAHHDPATVSGPLTVAPLHPLATHSPTKYRSGSSLPRAPAPALSGTGVPAPTPMPMGTVLVEVTGGAAHIIAAGQTYSANSPFSLRSASHHGCAQAGPGRREGSRRQRRERRDVASTDHDRRSAGHSTSVGLNRRGDRDVLETTKARGRSRETRTAAARSAARRGSARRRRTARLGWLV